MRNVINWIATIVIGVLLSSCSVAHYQVRYETDSGTTNETIELNEVKFSLIITSEHHTNTLGVPRSNNADMEKFKNKYITSTNKVFKKQGYISSYTENATEALFKLQVERSLSISALPQEWLTGLSLGLIPSWGTRPNQYIYSFENTITGSKHRYAVDQKSYNHLIFFPAFWISFFTLNEYRVYEKALIKFLEGS